MGSWDPSRWCMMGEDIENRHTVHTDCLWVDTLGLAHLADLGVRPADILGPEQLFWLKRWLEHPIYRLPAAHACFAFRLIW